MARFSSADEVIYADDDLFFFLDGALKFVGGFLDFALDEAGLDGSEHQAAHGVDFFDVGERAGFDFVGEGFDGVRACDGIDGVGHAGLVGDDLLRAQGDERGVFGGESERFVERIGVQRLAAAENGGESLDRHADDIIFRLLGGERRTGGLRVEAQEKRARILSSEAIAHDASPETPGRAILSDFFQQVAVRVEEKRELRSEVVDVESGVESRMDICDGVGEREGNFLDGGRASFANVIAGDGDGIPLREFRAAPGENVGDDAHRGADRIDVGAARDVFLKDVVLHGAGEFRQGRALPFRDSHIEAEKDGGGGVDGHGSGDFFQRDVVEERFHVFEGIDRHADFADFTEREGMIRVHANLRGKIEGYRETALAFAEEIAIALVGFGADPKPAYCRMVHRRPRYIEG